MNKIDLVISVAGWEDRFVLGIERDLGRLDVSELLLFAFREYTEQTKPNRRRVAELASKSDILFNEVEVSREPLDLWRAIRSTLNESFQGKSVLVNLSTMPREVLWWTFLQLEALQCEVQYVYYKPERYAYDWLTRDTG